MLRPWLLIVERKTDGKKIHVNPMQVTYIHETDIGDGVVIHFVGGEEISVEGNLDEIAECLDDTKTDE